MSEWKTPNDYWNEDAIYYCDYEERQKIGCQAWYRRSQACYSVAPLLTSPHNVRWISSARLGLYLITEKREFPCGLMRSTALTRFWDVT